MEHIWLFSRTYLLPVKHRKLRQNHCHYEENMHTTYYSANVISSCWLTSSCWHYSLVFTFSNLFLALISTSASWLTATSDNNNVSLTAAIIQMIAQQFPNHMAPGINHLTNEMIWFISYAPLLSVLMPCLCWYWNRILINWHTAQVILIYKKERAQLTLPIIIDDISSVQPFAPCKV